MPATFGGVSWAQGSNNSWRWESAFGPDRTNHVYFDSPTGVSRTFSFLAPQILVSVDAFGDQAGTLTLADDKTQTVSLSVTTGKMFTLTTGWKIPSTTVTVTYTAGWTLGLDNIVYQLPPAGPLQIPLANCCTVTFPILSGSQIPVCTAADGACSITIQVCDSANPPNCVESNSGIISFVKITSLPVPQRQFTTVVLAQPLP
jgi:hypothetical protein